MFTMILRDTLLDPRLADHPRVVGEPRIRFYAGCPLTLHCGASSGTLCLIDTRARDLDEEKINLLRDLRKRVEREMAPPPRP